MFGTTTCFAAVLDSKILDRSSTFGARNPRAYPTFNDLEFAVDSIIDTMQGKDNRSNRQIIKDIKSQGTKEVYRDNEWRVIQMTSPEAVFEMGKGTIIDDMLIVEDKFITVVLE